MVTKAINLIIINIILVTASSLVMAETTLYTDGNVPNAEEMADILLDNNQPRVKTRGLVFGAVEKKDPKSFGLPIKFDFNSDDLNQSSFPYLKQLGVMLKLEKMADQNIMIVGHTDASGEETYNLFLSKKRAEAVKSFLVSNYQIDPVRLKIMGKGELEILPGKPSNSSINRRVEFFRIP